MLGAGDIGMCGRPEVAQTARLVAGLEGDVLLAGDHRVLPGNGRELSRLLQSVVGTVSIALASGAGQSRIRVRRRRAVLRVLRRSRRPGRPGLLRVHGGRLADPDAELEHPGHPRIAAMGVRARASSSGSERPARWRSGITRCFHPAPTARTVQCATCGRCSKRTDAEVIVNGHDHLYERFARQTASGAARSRQRHSPVHRRHRRRRALQLRAGHGEFRGAHHEVRRDAFHVAARLKWIGSSSASTARSAIAASIPAGKRARALLAAHTCGTISG